MQETTSLFTAPQFEANYYSKRKVNGNKILGSQNASFNETRLSFFVLPWWYSVPVPYTTLLVNRRTRRGNDVTARPVVSRPKHRINSTSNTRHLSMFPPRGHSTSEKTFQATQKSFYFLVQRKRLWFFTLLSITHFVF